jgi:nucleoid DNA-binding protein
LARRAKENLHVERDLPAVSGRRSRGHGWNLGVAHGRETSDLPSRMKSAPEPSTQEVLAGLVARVTFRNPENGFCALRAKARGHRDLVTAVGHATTISAGEWITASGERTNDRTHRQQFRARFLKTSAPSSIGSGPGIVNRFQIRYRSASICAGVDSHSTETFMAKAATKTTKPVAAKKASRPVGASIRPVKETLTKSALIAHIAEQNELPRKTAAAVYATLEDLFLGSVHPRGVGEFTLPGLLKVSLRKVPARRAGTLVRNPSNGEMIKAAAKPASIRVKVRALSKLKTAAAP